MGKVYLAILILAALSCASAVQVLRSVTISMFATDLSKCDQLSKCDAFVEILCVSSDSDGRACGKTKFIQDDNFPIWPEEFTFANTSESVFKRWQFKVMDDDVAFNDPIATVVVTLPEFLAGTETQRNFKVDLAGRGWLYVTKLKTETEEV